ncbi:MAG TPA: tyrosine-type recombinase/integrase [Alphaproteobacteria bacterium]
MLDGWAKEASAAGKASESTREAYTRTVRKLIAFLGYDEANRVRPEDIVAFKDARLAEINPRTGKAVSAKTVNDGDLSGLKTVFGWGVKNRKVTVNPAAGITIAVAEKPKVRPKGFTDTEAAAILRHARNYKPGKAEYPKTSAAKKWTPWLCAYTGARIGEMVQLRKNDLRREGKVWLIRITPEAGTVKGRRMREVPLHPQLVELGFPAFVEKASDGYLFFNAAKGKWRGPWQAVKNRVGEFVREVVSDPNAKPNHGWRHRFITQARQHGIDQELWRMITGHTGEGVDERDYGDPAGLYREICKLPKYRVN